jgi:hypothetical protein
MAQEGGRAAANSVRSRFRAGCRPRAGERGLDIDTLQNWEQGRNRPDAAALSLIMAFDNAPHVIAQAGLEPVV